MIQRPNHHEYFMSLALMAAQRASCPRRKVGCVLVDGSKFIVSTGYNGPAAGKPNCTEKPCGGHLHKSGEGLNSCIAIHAEVNAINQSGDRLKNVTAMYLTAGPCCKFCTETVVKSIEEGRMPLFKTIYFFDRYPAGTEEIFGQLGIELVHMDQNLSADGLLLQTAFMLGLRIPYEPDEVLCVGGMAHGRLYTQTGSSFLRVDASNMRPDEHRLISYTSMDSDKISPNALVTTHDYYEASMVKNNKLIKIFKYVDLDDGIFKRLLADLMRSNPGYFI